MAMALSETLESKGNHFGFDKVMLKKVKCTYGAVRALLVGLCIVCRSKVRTKTNEGLIKTQFFGGLEGPYQNQNSRLYQTHKKKGHNWQGHTATWEVPPIRFVTHGLQVGRSTSE